MGTGNFSDDFKRDAVAQITERGYPVAEVSERLGVSQHSLYAWKRKFSKPSGCQPARLTVLGMRLGGPNHEQAIRTTAFVNALGRIASTCGDRTTAISYRQ
jgi:transposase-like protein